jgi:hypothetical protein
MRVVIRPIKERARLIVRDDGRWLIFRPGVISASLVAYLSKILRRV